MKNPLADPVRVAMLRGTGLLGAPPDEALDRLAALAGTVLEAPIAMLALLDDTHLHARACAGSRHLAKSGRTPVRTASASTSCAPPRRSWSGTPARTT